MLRMKTVSSFALAVAIFAATPTFAQIAPKAGFPQERYKEFTPDKDVKYGKLPNGMRYAIQKWNVPKGEVSIRMRIGAGAMNEAENQRGLMHFLEHMAFNGSQNIKEGEMVKILEREGLAFGPDTNAHTSWDEVVYKLDMPKAQKLDLGLDIMRETAGRLLLDKKAIDAERGVIKIEERTRNSIGLRQIQAKWKGLYDEYLFAKSFPIGDMNVIANAPRERFAELYNAFYAPERTMLVIVGDIDPIAAEKMIKAKFANWQKAKKPKSDPKLGTLKPNPMGVTIFQEPQVTQAISFVSPKNYVAKADTLEARQKSYLRAIGNYAVQKRMSKLTAAADSPILYAARTHEDIFKSVTEDGFLVIPREAGLWKEALKIGDLELRKIVEFGLTEDEVDFGVKSFRAALEKSLAQNGSRKANEIAEGIYTSFANDEVYTDAKKDLDIFDKMAAKINAASVSKILKSDFDINNMEVFIATPINIEGGEKIVKDTWAQARKVVATPPVVEAKKTWGYTNFGAPNAPKSVEEIAQLGAQIITFPNNTRLVLKTADFEKGKVSVSVNFGEGKLALPKDKAIWDMSLNSGFGSGGLGKLKSEDLPEALGGKSVNANIEVYENRFSLANAVKPDDLLLQLQLFAAYYTDPAYRIDEFSKLGSIKSVIYNQLKSQPMGVIQRELQGVLTSNDRRFAFPTESEWDALKIDDVRSIFDNARNNGSLEITIVGDIAKEDAIKAVSQTFGALPLRANAPAPRQEERKVSFPSTRVVSSFTHDGPKNQAALAMVWPTGGDKVGKNLQLASIIETLLDQKMTEVVREKMGSAYSPQSISQVSTVLDNFGYIGGILVLEPKDVEKVTVAVEEIAKDLAAGKIDADSFERAKKPKIAELDESLRTNSWWLRKLSGISFNPAQIERTIAIKKQLSEISIEDVKQAAKQYFDPSKVQIIQILPTK